MSTYETSMNSMETTGRYLVLLPQEDIDSGIRAITDATGMNNVARAADFESHALNAEQLESSTVALFDRLGVAVVELDARAD